MNNKLKQDASILEKKKGCACSGANDGPRIKQLKPVSGLPTGEKMVQVEYEREVLMQDDRFGPVNADAWKLPDDNFYITWIGMKNDID